MPVEYTAIKRAWVTTKITTEWFNSFVRQARQHCNSIGLKEDCKNILVMDNCTAHPPAETLSRDSVQVIYLPPNCTLHFLKYCYRSEFLRSFLSDLSGGKTCGLWQGLSTAFLNQLSKMPGTNCGRLLVTQKKMKMSLQNSEDSMFHRNKKCQMN
ncbi:hypothetical protein PR048_004849 [Dryococelus australis]|uniref:DDE-1 domain-containing protein n=1 Tax=Dryococelus australis TaxID=614101 RepID=A0ABQ9I7M7_9NEOP|nr:hypothetical protein PR048_004849 [Dryococelus australis]